MGVIDNIGERFTQSKVAKERVTARAEHKTGAPLTPGQRFARRVESMSGGPKSRPAELTNKAIRILGGEPATREENELLDGYTYTDKTGSTEHVSGVKTEDVPSFTVRVDAEIARQQGAQAKALGRELNAVEKATIESQRSDMLRSVTDSYLADLQKSHGPVAKMKLRVIQNQILEHAINPTRALGMGEPAPVTPVDPKNPTPEELEGLAAIAAFKESKAFLENADEFFEEHRKEQLRKKYRKRLTGPLALLASMVIDTVKLGTSSAPTGRQQ